MCIYNRMLMTVSFLKIVLVSFPYLKTVGHFLRFNSTLLVDKERTKKMLLEHDVHLEDFGGDVQSVCISAREVCHSVNQLPCTRYCHFQLTVMP